MADSHTARLCVEIIHSHFGPLTAKIASVLLVRGRLPLTQLIRFTALRPRTVRACILVLVQHNIIWHVLSDEGEMFEVNIDECLMRLRFGKFIYKSEELFGKPAAEVVQVILDHGKLKVPDIMSLLGIYDGKGIIAYNQAIHKLVSGHYLKPSTTLSHISPCDKRIQYEAEEKRKISGFPTAKELRQAKEVAEARLKREEEEAEKIGLKRKEKDQSGRSAKRKASESEESVDATVYFRVNYERFNVHLRNGLIVAAVKERFNHQAALVIRAAMKVTEQSQLSVSEVRSEPISVANIMMQLPEDEDLGKGLAYSSKKTSNATCIKEYLGMLSSADNPTAAGRESSFVSFGTSKVQVEFEVVGRRLRRRLVESVAREKHGVEGVRILRLLSDTGKMDEKQISKIVMMAPKDVRPLLAALASDSLISMQEVPKSADRNPTRTFYLWYVDLNKAHLAILGNVFKTLYNISMRRRAQREVPEVAAVLEKCERTDVSQDENLLTRLEKDILKEWKEKQFKLTGLEARVEESVFVLRDLRALASNDD